MNMNDHEYVVRLVSLLSRLLKSGVELYRSAVIDTFCGHGMA